VTLKELKLDTDGIAKLLLSEDFGRAVHDAATDIAAAVEARTDLPVVVHDYVTDRRASAVTITDRRGQSEQAKHGALTRAAGELGYDVHGAA